jgi:Domain of unknown function (DUF932)
MAQACNKTSARSRALRSAWCAGPKFAVDPKAALSTSLAASDATFQRISIKHSGFNPDSVIEASFKVLGAVPDIMNKVQLFQDRILTDVERLALATGAATYRWEDPNKAPVNASMLLESRRYGDGAKDLWTTLNTVQ